MPSASPENPSDALVGVDPTDTRVVAIGGARFTLGVMSAEDWEDISGRLLELRSEAIPAAIRSIVARGEDPDGKSVTGVPLLTLEMVKDKGFNRAMAEMYLKALSLTLVKVEGFVNSSGAPMPFVREGGVLSDATLEVYRRNMRVTERLWLDIAGMNTLGGTAKKP